MIIDIRLIDTGSGIIWVGASQQSIPTSSGVHTGGYVVCGRIAYSVFVSSQHCRMEFMVLGHSLENSGAILQSHLPPTW